MNSQLRICRVCQDSSLDGELVRIFEKSNQIANGIFLISGVKVCEVFVCLYNFQYFFAQVVDSYRTPALICRSCVKDLCRSMKFRHRCRETDDFFKKTTHEAENLIWNGGDEASGSQAEVDFNVKQEQELNSDGQKIKDEPTDDFSIDLFENIDTILEENGSEESNTLAGILSKKEELSDGSEESESEYEELRERKKRSKRKRSLEFNDFNIG